ncbi:MAG: hypothetical protein ABFD79_05470 [Phycisphaerales bacterium]
METYNKISVTAPVSEAIERTKLLLFKPFNLEKWFVIGFCAWLATLFNQGFNFSGNFNFAEHDQNCSEEIGKVFEYVKENFILVGAIAAAVIVIILAITLVLLWLNSRGHFMFLDCLAKKKAQVIEPWKNFKDQANSLFWFRLVFGFIGFIVVAILSVPIVLVSLAYHSNGLALATLIVVAVLMGLFITATLLFFGIVKILTIDFVVPIMYLRKIRTIAAWKIYLTILGPAFWKTILYLLFKLLISIVVGTLKIIVFLVGCCTCCLWILLCIPYLGTVIYLPLISFMRFYPICFLRQFGSEYDVFI